MPIYEGMCQCDDKIKEYWSNISSRDNTICPDCKTVYKKVISATAGRVDGGTPHFNQRHNKLSIESLKKDFYDEQGQDNQEE